MTKKQIVPVSDWKDRMFQHAITGSHGKLPEGMPVAAVAGVRTGQLAGHLINAAEQCPWLGEHIGNFRGGYQAGTMLTLKRYEAGRAVQEVEKAAKKTRQLAHKAVEEATKQNLKNAALAKTKDMADAIMDEVTTPKMEPALA